MDILVELEQIVIEGFESGCYVFEKFRSVYRALISAIGIWSGLQKVDAPCAVVMVVHRTDGYISSWVGHGG